MKSIFRFLSSLKLAVVTVLALAGGLAVGTFLESLHDTKTAQFYVYQAVWFQAVLVIFGINILAVALSRLPWRRKHLAFLLAHLGILCLLAGSFVTQKRGLDAQLRVTEGETSSAVEIDEGILYLSERGKGADQVWSTPIRWVPEKKLFRPVEVKVPGWSGVIRATEFIPYAEVKTRWVEDPEGRPAIELKIEGGPMQISESFWLWSGDSAAAQSKMGPATFYLLDEQSGITARELDPRPGPWLAIEVSKNKTLSFRSKSSDSKISNGPVSLHSPLDSGFRGGVKLSLQSFLKGAKQEVTYNEPRFAEMKKGLSAALKIEIPEAGESAWIGLGDRVVLTAQGRKIDVAYVPRRIFLPFALSLERFTIDTNPGTRDPSSYHSDVRVIDGSPQATMKSPSDPIRVAMNEPLDYRGFTFYQASYEPAAPRPVTSIFSVNQDPGRPLKYFGSFVLVAGIALLFIEKSMQQRKKT